MAGGVFDNGAAITLGGDCHLVPSSSTQRSQRAPRHQTQEQIFDVGGGYYRHIVAGEIERHNQGDAEWWARTKLLALGASGLGDLSVNGLKFADAMFRNGRCRVEAHCVVNYFYEFVQSLQLRTATLAAGDTPGADEAEYAGRGTTDIYHLAGEQLGVMGALQLSVRRQLTIKRIPRAYGVRIEDAHHARSLELAYNGYHHCDTYAELVEWCWQMQARIGYQEATLDGCGNTWSNVFLQSLEPSAESDVRGWQFAARMIQYAA